MTPKSVMAHIVNSTPQPKVAIVASELHKDGFPHIHIFLEYSRKRNIKDPRHFDHFCGGQHGNISTVNSAHKTLAYITKDSIYELFGITQKQLDIILSGTSYVLGEVAAYIADNPDINEVAIKFPTHFIHYHTGLSHLCQIHRHRQSTRISPMNWDLFRLAVSQHCPSDSIPNSLSLLVAWVLVNFDRNISHPRPLRAPQLWLHGTTGCGKTRFLAFMSEHYRGYLLPAMENFYGGYNDFDIDYLYLDEFHGNKKLYFLNSLLGGEPMNMAFKGGQYCKRSNKPVIICSNQTPVQCYSNISIHRPLVWDAFLSRLLVIDISDANLHFFLDTVISFHMSSSSPPPRDVSHVSSTLSLSPICSPPSSASFSSLSPVVSALQGGSSNPFDGSSLPPSLAGPFLFQDTVQSVYKPKVRFDANVYGQLCDDVCVFHGETKCPPHIAFNKPDRFSLAFWRAMDPKAFSRDISTVVTKDGKSSPSCIIP